MADSYLTVYPDAGTGNTTVDGRAYRTTNGTWAEIRGGAGEGAGDTDAFTSGVYYLATAAEGQWTILIRSIYTLDTSALTAAANISAATFSVYPTSKDDGLSDSIALVGSTPANDNALVAADYGQVGTTLYAPVIALADITLDTYNAFTLNGTGLAAISKTGITKLGLTGEHDRAGIDPWIDSQRTDFVTYFADQADTTYDPKLVITYTTGGGSPYTLTADAGAFTLTGTAATLLWKQILDAAAGSFVLTGSAVTMNKGFTMAAAAGSFTLSGTAADLLHDHTLDAAAGSYTLSGTAAGLLHAHLLDAAAGSFVLSGTAATLLQKQILTASGGTFTLSGTAADLLHDQILDAAGGTFTLTGTAADLLRGYAIDAGSGTFTLTGTAADLLHHRVFPVGSGAFVLTGFDATLTYAALFSGTAGVNTFTVTALPANLLSVTMADNELSVDTLPNNEFEVVV